MLGEGWKHLCKWSVLGRGLEVAGGEEHTASVALSWGQTGLWYRAVE